ncbi:Uma2 family endonuclease [Actinomycetospora aeridis]|uniref:Uma2 family endonuclease n=1 Tax=Actinomycetospora aeridis TaxID=3129231 RepID=A0ABU8N8S8_9PSEU
MTTDPWPTRLLDLDEFRALPDDDRRSELVEGVLSVTPPPSVRHQRIADRLARAVDDALPVEHCAVTAVGIVLEGGPTPTVRVPDVVVVRHDAVDDRPDLDASDVLAVVEVLSPGSRRRDRMVKLAEYAEAGIPRYAIVDPGPPVVLTAFALDGGRYGEGAEHRGRTVVDLGCPIPVDLATLAG